MVEIRKGQMKDCKHLLTVYQGTHWVDGYTNVEQIKEIHKKTGFVKWGWLVAEKDDNIVGEIIFHTEKNPVAKKIGVIDDIGVDVRYQKKFGIGRELVAAAEEALREKKVSRVYLITPPEAYNFWMKVKYFARGTLQQLGINPRNIATKRSNEVSFNEIKSEDKIPTKYILANLATPGKSLDLIREFRDGKKTGRIFEFLKSKKFIGIGIIIKHEDGSAEFSADVTKKGVNHFEFVGSKTAKTGTRLRANSVFTIVPADIVETYMNLGAWDVKRYRGIPVTKLI